MQHNHRPPPYFPIARRVKNDPSYRPPSQADEHFEHSRGYWRHSAPPHKRPQLSDINELQTADQEIQRRNSPLIAQAAPRRKFGSVFQPNPTHNHVAYSVKRQTKVPSSYCGSLDNTIPELGELQLRTCYPVCCCYKTPAAPRQQWQRALKLHDKTFIRLAVGQSRDSIDRPYLLCVDLSLRTLLLEDEDAHLERVRWYGAFLGVFLPISSSSLQRSSTGNSLHPFLGLDGGRCFETEQQRPGWLRKGADRTKASPGKRVVYVGRYHLVGEQSVIPEMREGKCMRPQKLAFASVWSVFSDQVDGRAWRENHYNTGTWKLMVRETGRSPIRASLHVQAVHGARGGVVVRLLASHLGEPGPIPGGVAPGFSRVGIVPNDAAGRRVFLGISRFPVPSFRRCSILSYLHARRLSRPRSAEGKCATSYAIMTCIDHELVQGHLLPTFWPRLMSRHPIIQFVPKMFYRVGALGGSVQSANIVVGSHCNSVHIPPVRNAPEISERPLAQLPHVEFLALSSIRASLNPGLPPSRTLAAPDFSIFPHFSQMVTTKNCLLSGFGGIYSIVGSGPESSVNAVLRRAKGLPGGTVTAARSAVNHSPGSRTTEQRAVCLRGGEVRGGLPTTHSAGPRITRNSGQCRSPRKDLKLGSQPSVASFSRPSVSQSSVCFFVRQLKATHNNPSSADPSAQPNFSFPCDWPNITWPPDGRATDGCGGWLRVHLTWSGYGKSRRDDGFPCVTVASVWPAGWIVLPWNAIAAFVYMIHDTSHYDTTPRTVGAVQ
ncbi:hypothetical protein PR048_016269 [Dryococelus australis]|uniref:Uncharacterized protein n=1 Tax=Dryococelus australis TaxID=614101 RepID=A0ABQ9HJ92_9NEOP|nr:hypothetical protein PR048_016269 [Dryococelus australis]